MEDGKMPFNVFRGQNWLAGGDLAHDRDQQMIIALGRRLEHLDQPGLAR
jgi:hypothetical protein